MNAHRPPQRVAIVGLGLIGGSLARALHRLPAPPRISATSLDPAALEAALDAGIVDHAPGRPEEAVADAEIVVFATPVGATLELLPACAQASPAAAVLTDVASVKRAVVRLAHDSGLADRFVGGHPVAGDHRAGFDAARADLFDGARVWLTAVPGAPAPADPDAPDTPFGRVAALWRAAGAEPRMIDAERHDQLMAWISHLPQITATALAAALARAGVPVGQLGPGGRDVTRLAASPGSLWAEILEHNADLLERPVRDMIASLEDLAAALHGRDRDELRTRLDDARFWREDR